MGNQNAKTKSQTHFTEAELKALEASFRGAAAAHTDKLMKEKFLESWSAHIDAHLAARTANFLYSTAGATSATPQRAANITVRRYGEPYYIVERGSIDEKLHFLASSMEKTDANQFAVKELENYVASVLKSYLNIHTVEHRENDPFKTWLQRGYQSTERSVLGFAKGLTRSLVKEDHHFYMDQLESWLQFNPTFLIIWREVFVYVYSQLTGKPSHGALGNGGNTHNANPMLPQLEGLATGTNYTPILDLPHVVFLNSNLPNGQRHKWRFLFSSKIMGESFSTMLGKILNRGPTLLVIEDEDRYIFGGYAPESWALRPSFAGDDTSLLFTLSPAMRVFGSTGYNNHYQYLNLSQQTMPNGLGMGGQFNYWGLWLDSEYGLGQSSESCTTYCDYVQLSKRKEFRIRNVEVWGIGDEPKVGDDSDEEGDISSGSRKPRSVLDNNLEDRVMLELSGRKMHSDGLREPEMDL